MKRIDTTKETATSWSPFKVESKAFMQDANKEMVQSLCRNIISNRGLIYSPTTPYFISSFSTSFTSDGAVFFGDELYIMRENSSSLLYAKIDTTPDPVADPTTFSDGVIQNIHNNRYLTYSNAATGSLFPVANIINVAIRTVIPFINITPNANWVVSSTYFGSPNVFQYRKNSNNEIEFRGFVQNTDSGVTSTVFVLPVGFRPTNVKEFGCRSAVTAGGGGSGVTRAVIFPNGNVNVYLVSSDYNSFDNVRFSLD